MAEFVQFRAEEWVAELEQMERIGLFEPKEIKSIVTKRKQFEYKIQRKTKCKEDYLKYIQFEIDLSRIIKARRKKTGIKTKKAEIEHSLTFRIGNLFKCVIFKFPSDIKLWMSFFKFCKGVKFHSLVSQMLVRMLQVHPDKVDLWIFAAKWEFEQCHSMSNARQFLMRGLRIFMKNNLDKELFWATIARLEFEGFPCDLTHMIGGEEKMEVDEEKEKEKEKNVEDNEKEADNKKKATMRERIERSINVYEEAVKKFNSVKMWSFYLDFVIKINEDVKSLPNFKSKLLRKAMEGAMASGNMAEKYYIEWITILQKAGGKNTKLLEVLNKGTEHHPKSLKLWFARLKFSLYQDPENVGMEIFEKAIENLTDAAPIWKLVVKYLVSKSSPKAEEVLRDGIRRGSEVAQTLKPLYIEWLVQTKGIEEAWKVFETPEMNLYPCLELYENMAELELKQAEPRLDRVRRCYELACSSFGGDVPGVWLKYVSFELKIGDASKVAQIHRRALKALKPDVADEFLSEFNNFKAGISA